MPLFQRRLLFLTLAALHLVGLWLSVPAVYRMDLTRSVSDVVVPIYFGMSLGLLALLALYLGWGGEPLVRRVFFAIWGWLLFWATLISAIRHTGDSFSIGALPNVLAVVLSVGTLLQLLPFAVSRAVFDVRLEHRTGPVRARTRQFALRDLALWTAVTAFVLAGVRVLNPTTDWFRWELNFEDLIGLTIASVAYGTLGLMLAFPVGCRMLKQNGSKRSVRLLAVYLALLPVLELAVALPLAAMDPTMIKIILLMNLGLSLEVFGGYFVLRLAGYRLVGVGSGVADGVESSAVGIDAGEGKGSQHAERLSQ